MLFHLVDVSCGGIFLTPNAHFSQGKRSESKEIVASEVEKDVSDLIAAGICPSSDSSRVDIIVQIFACRSEAHLCQVFKKFLEVAQCHVQVVIEKLFKADVKDALLAISKHYVGICREYLRW